MLLIQFLFVAASLITQAYLFRESGPSHTAPSQSPSQSSSGSPFPSQAAAFAAEARRADSILYVTYGIFPPAVENRSTAESDTSPTREPCALR
jgi:hypothetical protein